MRDVSPLPFASFCGTVCLQLCHGRQAMALANLALRDAEHEYESETSA